MDPKVVNLDQATQEVDQVAKKIPMGLMTQDTLISTTVLRLGEIN